jgi:CheY-like chemotaxis protein
MHGVINYTSSDQGSNFYFDLPVQPSEIITIDTAHVINKADLAQTGPDTMVNILHIENDEDFAQITHKSLEHLSHISNVKSRHAALDALRNGHYDLVILDLMLADGFAADLIGDIHDKGIPIIVYSAYELPPKYLPYVQHVLTKSKSSYKKLLSLVQAIRQEKIERGMV